MKKKYFLTLCKISLNQKYNNFDQRIFSFIQKRCFFDLKKLISEFLQQESKFDHSFELQSFYDLWSCSVWKIIFLDINICKISLNQRIFSSIQINCSLSVQNKYRKFTLWKCIIWKNQRKCFFDSKKLFFECAWLLLQKLVAFFLEVD